MLIPIIGRVIAKIIIMISYGVKWDDSPATQLQMIKQH